MGLRDCSCAIPVPFPSPTRRHQCVKCSFRINPAWTSNDKTVAWFFDGLLQSVPAQPAYLRIFREHCEQRELAGRERFGHRLLGRDNVIDGTEEAADGGLYAFFDTLKARRAGDRNEVDLALTAAWHFAKAHDALLHLKAKRAGSP